MTTEPSPQRAYRAACPNCGAPVDFRSAASAFAVCSFCRSTLVRDGETLRKTGEASELFDDHSPLQLGATGAAQGSGFTLVGRLQYKYGQGTWNEWHALFDSGRSGWLSEDNGAYVLGFDAPLDRGELIPPSDQLIVGNALTVAGVRWHVASLTNARIVTAQGELPAPPNTQVPFAVADLRAAGGDVATLSYADRDRPTWSVGRSVALADLAMSGLNDGSGGSGGGEKTLSARGVECPNCGAALEVRLTTTQSIVCHQCHAVVDVSAGVGGDLKHYAQNNGAEPLIPLGTVGSLRLGGPQALAWQVVGYVERCELPEDDDDEQSFWREYLLYHRTTGFAFLIDAEDGWSWSAPITGAPEGNGQKMSYRGVTYQRMYTYTGVVTYVLGEFYWQLQRDQKTYNTDYMSGPRRLNREETREAGATEVVWSAGEALSAKDVLKAFRLPDDKAAAFERDVAPAGGGSSWVAIVIMLLVCLFVVLLLVRCASDSGRDCEQVRDTYGNASQEYQSCIASRRSHSSGSGGSSWGGYSSGGSHK